MTNGHSNGSTAAASPRILQVHRLTWAFRSEPEISQSWATPPRNDSLAYAVTEVGEAVDAHLKAGRPGDLRRVRQGHETESELAMAAVMLLTAFGDTVPVAAVALDLPAMDADRAIVLASIAKFAACAWCNASMQRPWQYDAIGALTLIERMLGDELVTRCTANFNHIRNRVRDDRERVAR